MGVFFANGSCGESCITAFVGHDVDESTEAIISALDDHLEQHEDDDTWYSFHEFEEVGD